MITIKSKQKEYLDMLRKDRETICFPIVNRGKLWYNTLTKDELIELEKWYHDWLNVTETLIVPNAPSFLCNKINIEEEIL